MAATPSRATESGSDADASPQGRLLAKFYQFIRVDYLGEGKVSPTAYPEMYASRVDYFERGEISRERVLAEKQTYYSRWPRRVFEMIDGSIKAQPVSDDEVELFFRYKFDVSNDSTTRRGIATATLRIALDGDRFVIRGEKGGVEKRL